MGNGCQMSGTRVAGCSEIDGQSWSARPPIATGRADTPALQKVPGPDLSIAQHTRGLKTLAVRFPYVWMCVVLQ
jgi:hypothetical protein